MAKPSSSMAINSANTLVSLRNSFIILLNQPRPFFVFGDSLVDNGNNNFLITPARADIFPYSIDSPSKLPTGRFFNGLNIPDIISEHIGSEPVLPFLSLELHEEKLPLGANFASAGVGILNDTGFQFGEIIAMPLQLEYFKVYQQKLSSLVGEEKAKDIVNRALVLVSLGGNDFVNNYYLVPFSTRSLQYTLPEYVIYLVSEYRKILMKMYEMGVRRAILLGSRPLGCAPAEIAQHNELSGECSTDLQAAAELFEPQVDQMVKNLNAELGTEVFISASTRLMYFDMMNNPQAYGFVTSKSACCGQGAYNGLDFCNAYSNLCENRDELVFWDAFHPSERACRLIVEKIVNGTDDYMRPMNLTTIMYLDSRV
ncbi:GDSL esterase/lipase At5g33370 [Lactuca sativa]|uniref:GDSL esterase/lipase At5g33370 n=1 Tax=Lactuca sativa TaxID=4236 RepID=UPI000CD98B57|nr:GDSL esterase/lipase At5g33370 [Lactuca sativa]